MAQVNFKFLGVYQFVAKYYRCVQILVQDVAELMSRKRGNTQKETLIMRKSRRKCSLQRIARSVIGLGTVVKGTVKSLSPEKRFDYHITMAEIAIKDGNLKNAEFHLEKALTVSDSTTVGVTCAYDMLATIAYKQGNVTKAENFLLEIIDKLVKSGVAPNHNTVVNFSLKLARIYDNLGQDDLAEMGFRNCLAIQKKKYMSGETDEETSVLWINTLFWYGKFLAHRERFPEAKQCFESAYTMCARVKSVDTNQAMVMLYNLGEMAYATGDLDGALRHLQNAVILGRSAKSPDLPMYYTKIGLLYFHKEVYDQAQHWCAKGYETGRKFKNRQASREAEDCVKQVKRALQNQK